MEYTEKISWLRLIRCENVGPVTFKTLLDHFGSAQEALHHLPDFARRGGRSKPLRICTLDQAEKEIENTEMIGAKVLYLREKEYPALLRNIPDAPVVISVLGNTSLLNKPHIALVGTRNASINGKNMARRMAFDFIKSGYCVASGLALGIDTAAHEGALYGSTPDVSTTAILGTGIDGIYPEQNRRLFQEMKEKGLLVSDFEFGTKPQPSNFPRRNRIISGLCSGLVVIEADLRSGSMITANKALEQGRDVFAVPANPLDSRAQGVNHLIKNGAPLVESAKDVLSHLNTFTQIPLLEQETTHFNTVSDSYDFSDTVQAQTRKTLLDKLGSSPIEIDTLVREMSLPASLISVLLVELELAGHIERCPGNRVLRTLPF